MQILVRAATLCCVAAAALAAPALAASGSAHTRHTYPTCRQAADDGVVETRLCVGFGGILVRWSGEPDGTSIAFGNVASDDGLGEDFANVGSTIEWRGPLRAGTIQPVAAIVRVEVGRSIAGPVQRRLLVVHKLRAAGGSCIVAVVDAGKAGANARARTAADAIVPGFRCGVDARRSL